MSYQRNEKNPYKPYSVSKAIFAKHPIEFKLDTPEYLYITEMANLGEKSKFLEVNSDLSRTVALIREKLPNLISNVEAHKKTLQEQQKQQMLNKIDTQKLPKKNKSLFRSKSDQSLLSVQNNPNISTTHRQYIEAIGKGKPVEDFILQLKSITLTDEVVGNVSNIEVVIKNLEVADSILSTPWGSSLLIETEETSPLERLVSVVLCYLYLFEPNNFMTDEEIKKIICKSVKTLESENFLHILVFRAQIQQKDRITFVKTQLNN